MSARAQAVEAAGELAAILEQRDGSHGEWTRNAAKAQAIKEQLTSIETDVLREAADAIAAKLARIASNGECHVDSWIDIAGYALLAAGYLRDEGA